MLVRVSRQGFSDGWWGAWSGRSNYVTGSMKETVPLKQKSISKLVRGETERRSGEMKEQNVCCSCILSIFRAFLLWTKMLNSTKTARKAVWQSFHSLKKQQPLINSSRVTDLSKAEKNWPPYPCNSLGSIWAISKILRVSFECVLESVIKRIPERQ